MGPLGRRIVMLCDAVIGELPDGPARERVRGTRDSLREPLRVAIAGRLKAGKSTLVNALLRQRVAPVDVGECTRVVTWFRYDARERVEVCARDGRRWDVTLEVDGRLPMSLGADPSDIEYVTAWLSNDTLRTMTLIDTPGRDSLQTEPGDSTERLLGVDGQSQAAILRADALVFLVPHVTETDQALLRSFRNLFAGTGLSAVNAIGVLSKIDQVAGDVPDPMQVGRELARTYERRLRGDVAAVVPVIGLLAETSESESFTERDALALRRLAELDPAIREEMLLSASWFVDDDRSDVERSARARLLTLLDLHGSRRALELIDGGYGDTATLLARLSTMSGINELRELLHSRFTTRGDALKAYVALNDLERLSYDSELGAHASLGRLRYAIEDLRLDPAMHRVNELEALRLWATGACVVSPELAEDLERMDRHVDARARLGLEPDAPDEQVREAALGRATRWLEFENDSRAEGPAVRVATYMRDSMTFIWQEASR